MAAVNAHTLERIGPCDVVRMIGEGGMAWVFEVRDPDFPARRLALKLMKPMEQTSDEEWRLRFSREHHFAARITHPNLVSPYHHGRDEQTGCFYYTMTLVDGPNLGELVAECGPLPPSEIVRIYTPILDALAELHAALPEPIIHRDIKPGNILLTRSGLPYLGDLGVAREQSARDLTRTGSFIGSVRYASPEQFRGRPLSPRTDVFSAGLAIYQSATGRTVYDDVDDVDTDVESDVVGYLVHLDRVGEELPFRFPDFVPPSLRELIRRACRIEPADRFEHARAMQRALLGLDTSHVEQGPRGFPRDGYSSEHRGRDLGKSAKTVTAAALLALLGASAYAAIELRHERHLSAGLASLEAQSAALEALRADLPEAVADLDPLLAHGRAELASAREARARGLDPEALLERTEVAFDQWCARADGALEPITKARAAPLLEALATLEPLEPARHAPSAWRELDEIAHRVETGADTRLPPCVALDGRVDRLRDVEIGQGLVETLRAELARRGPILRDLASASAETTREAARRDRLESAPDWHDAIERADALYARARREEDPLRAAELFGAAKRAYDEVILMAPAVSARARIERLRPRAGAPESAAQRMIEEGERSYTERRWAEAWRKLDRAAAYLELEQRSRTSDDGHAGAERGGMLARHPSPMLRDP